MCRSRDTLSLDILYAVDTLTVVTKEAAFDSLPILARYKVLNVINIVDSLTPEFL